MPHERPPSDAFVCLQVNVVVLTISSPYVPSFDMIITRIYHIYIYIERERERDQRSVSPSHGPMVSIQHRTGGVAPPGPTLPFRLWSPDRSGPAAEREVDGPRGAVDRTARAWMAVEAKPASSAEMVLATGSGRDAAAVGEVGRVGKRGRVGSETIGWPVATPALRCLEVRGVISPLKSEVHKPMEQLQTKPVRTSALVFRAWRSDQHRRRLRIRHQHFD